MLIYAGIDEAGYGPMLGPLCVSVAAFVLDDADPGDGAPNLWSILRGAVCRGRRDRRQRVAVDDSKRLKGPRDGASHPLRHLERGVLAFRMTLGGALAAPWPDDAKLLETLGARVEDQPWYRSTTTLPVGQTAEELRIAASRLLRVMTRAGVRCEMMRCTAIDAARFNEGVARRGRKSDVNLAAALRHAAAVWRRWPDAHPRIIVDRQGGRTRHLGPLRAVFPGASVEIVAESDAVSRYRLARGGSRLTVSFVRESESRHLPVALASMTAKYVRELHMIRLNRFFHGRDPALRPTAGYVQDGRRYLRDIEPLIRELGLTRSSLVRAV